MTHVVIQALAQHAVQGIIYTTVPVTILVQSRPIFLGQIVQSVEAIVMCAVPQVSARHAVQGIIFIMESVIILVPQPPIFRVQPVQHAQAIVIHAVLQAYAQFVALVGDYTKANVIILAL